MKALGVLAERVPGIALPPPKAPAADNRPRIVEGGVPEPEEVPSHPSRIAGLRIDPVAGPAARAVWNTLVAREHPHGMTTFAGRQLRYLVGSDHGWLGGVLRRRAAGRGAGPLWPSVVDCSTVSQASQTSPWRRTHLPDNGSNSRRSTRKSIYRLLLKKHGNRCQSCGVEEPPLEMTHIIPLSRGGDIGLDNFVLLCRNCHYLLNSFRPREVEFVHFLSVILSDSRDYSDVVVESPLLTRESRNLRADITATRLANGKRQNVLIEVKPWPSFGMTEVHRAIERIELYRQAGSFDAAALVFPGRLGEDGKGALDAAGIEVWDLDYVAAAFADEIAAQRHSGFRLLYSIVARSGGRSPSDVLIARLKACRPGTEDWAAYQRIVADVFELLFVPPLMRHSWESSDAL